MESIIYYFTNLISNYIQKFTEIVSFYLIPIAIVLVVFLIALAFKKKFSNLIISIIHKTISKGPFQIEKSSLDVLKRPLQIIFIFSAVFVSVALQGEITARNPNIIPFLTHLYRLSIILSMTYLLYAVVPVIVNVINKRKSKDEESTSDNTLMIYFSKILRVVIIIISVFIVLGEFGINLGGLIAGAGIGGLVLALASQDTAANLFGGLVIISDKPFSVGDWIQTSAAEGIVEDITFRSTRIRTFDDSLLVVPNSTLANSAITNWSKMTKRRVKFSIGLTYDTPPILIKNVINQIVDMLNNHPEVVEESAIVRLDDFADSSLDIIIIYHANQTALAELKRIREEINFEIINIVHSNNTNFAFPSTSLYIEKK